MYAHTGKVVWFNKAMGFGFLSSGDVGEVFVHEAAIEAADRMLRDGETVEFDTKLGADGKPQASKVKPLT